MARPGRDGFYLLHEGIIRVEQNLIRVPGVNFKLPMLILRQPLQVIKGFLIRQLKSRIVPYNAMQFYGILLPANPGSDYMSVQTDSSLGSALNMDSIHAWTISRTHEKPSAPCASRCLGSSLHVYETSLILKHRNCSMSNRTPRQTHQCNIGQTGECQ